jgi:hypothetical protein
MTAFVRPLWCRCGAGLNVLEPGARVLLIVGAAGTMLSEVRRGDEDGER